MLTPATRITSSLVLLLLLLVPAAVRAQFTFTTNNGAITITAYTGPGGDVVIPDTTNGLLVTTISRWAFAQRYHIWSVRVPSNVTNVEDQAFYQCYDLLAVFFLGDAPVTGLYTFWGDQNRVFYVYGTKGWGSAFAGLPTALWDPPNCLTYVITNNAVVVTDYIGNEGDLELPSSLNAMPVVAIGDNAFRLCTFTNITIPNSVTNIGEAAFGDCYGLTSITIPETVCGAADYWFAYCTNLRSISIPSTLTRLGYGLFLGCSSLQEITIRGNIDLVLDLSFGYCPSLKRIFFTGNAPTYIGDRAFENTANATIYYLPGTSGWGSMLGPRPALLWNPQIRTLGDGFGVRTNQFCFTVSGTSNIPIVLEAATNLATGTWAPLQSCSLTNGSICLSDPQWTNYPSRFYRIRSP